MTPEELAWVADLERVFKAMPRRLKLVECADSVFVVDRAASHEVDLHDGKARANGVILIDVAHSVMVVTGVSG